MPNGLVMLAWKASVGNSRDRWCSQRLVTQAGTCAVHRGDKQQSVWLHVALAHVEKHQASRSRRQTRMCACVVVVCVGRLRQG